jgi:Ser/Thr protein kinase RdoA (MazF antagonist)
MTWLDMVDYRAGARSYRARDMGDVTANAHYLGDLLARIHAISDGRAYSDWHPGIAAWLQWSASDWTI